MSNLTIDDLLNSLKITTLYNKGKLKLENTAETWQRIGEKDSFSELGLDSSELDDFLKEWIENNEYSNL